jgi:hypothetical protein
MMIVCNFHLHVINRFICSPCCASYSAFNHSLLRALLPFLQLPVWCFFQWWRVGLTDFRILLIVLSLPPGFKLRNRQIHPMQQQQHLSATRPRESELIAPIIAARCALRVLLLLPKLYARRQRGTKIVHRQIKTMDLSNYCCQ